MRLGESLRIMALPCPVPVLPARKPQDPARACRSKKDWAATWADCQQGFHSCRVIVKCPKNSFALQPGAAQRLRILGTSYGTRRGDRGRRQRQATGAIAKSDRDSETDTGATATGISDSDSGTCRSPSASQRVPLVPTRRGRPYAGRASSTRNPHGATGTSDRDRPPGR